MLIEKILLVATRQENVMRAKRISSLWFVTLMIGLGGCGSTPRPIPHPIPSPTPSSTASISISPVSAVEGSPDLTLTVTAMGARTFFHDPHNKSIVVWSANGSDTPFLDTNFVSSTQLTAVIPAALLAVPVTANVSVETGDPMGSLPLSKSDSVPFVVGTGQLSISSISPSRATIGSSDVTLTVLGAGFADVPGRYNSSVVWSANGDETFLTTRFDSDTQLTAVIPAALLTNPIIAEISVQTWFKEDSFPTAVSNSAEFSVTPP
jgi:hypothetical protein